MTAKLLAAFKQKIAGLTLVPSGGGCFEIELNGELVYSKLRTDDFPDEAWVMTTVQDRLKK